jgi:hypothetical protein
MFAWPTDCKPEFLIVWPKVILKLLASVSLRSCCKVNGRNELTSKTGSLLCNFLNRIKCEGKGQHLVFTLVCLMINMCNVREIWTVWRDHIRTANCRILSLALICVAMHHEVAGLWGACYNFDVRGHYSKSDESLQPHTT